MVDTATVGTAKDYLDAAKRAAENKRFEAAVASALICIAQVLVEDRGYPPGYPELGG